VTNKAGGLFETGTDYAANIYICGDRRLTFGLW
jgi:hypothetical protein